MNTVSQISVPESSAIAMSVPAPLLANGPSAPTTSWEFEPVDVDFAASELMSSTEFCSIMCGACSGGGCS